MSRRERPSASTPVTRATASTWPDTRCPPRGSPARSAGSRFTAAPTASVPSVVSARVSRERSATKLRPARAVTVRQQPCTQTLSPMPRRASSRRVKAMVRRRSPPRSSRPVTSPTSNTIPVNIRRPFSCQGVPPGRPSPFSTVISAPARRRSRASPPTSRSSKSANEGASVSSASGGSSTNGSAAGPSSFGATYSSSSSTSDCLTSAPARVAPASTCSSLISSSPSRSSAMKRGTRPASAGRVSMRAPWAASAAACASHRGSAVGRVLRISTSPGTVNKRASGGVRSVLSSTTRSGWRRPGPSAASASLTSSRGSSASTVPTPVSTAELRARHCCTSSRAAAPEIQRLAPLPSAVRPSRLMASFTRTHGRPWRMRLRNPQLSSAASPASRPASTRTCASRSRAAPRPSTCGLGSAIAYTTRATRAPISASTHGGVRPWWLHGSSVTYTVAPAARPPAARSAATSACASPARSCQPSPTIRSPCAITQPTRGFGSVLSSPRAASSRARAIALRSKSVKVVATDRAARTLFRLAAGARLAVVVRRLERQERQLIAVDRAGAAALVRGPRRGSERCGAARLAQPLDLVVESLDVLELAVDGGEADIGHLIEVPQLFHHQLADRARAHFAISEAAHGVDDAAHGFIELLTRHRAFLQRLLHPRAQLRLIEGLARGIALDDHGHEELGGLEGREALAAFQALTPPPDLPSLAGEPRVVDLGLFVAAERTVHASGAVDREAPAQLQHLGAHPLDHGCLALGVQHLRDEIRHLLDLALPEAARGR